MSPSTASRGCRYLRIASTVCLVHAALVVSWLGGSPFLRLPGPDRGAVIVIAITGVTRRPRYGLPPVINARAFPISSAAVRTAGSRRAAIR
jgi:hypothetical protein